MAMIEPIHAQKEEEGDFFFGTRGPVSFWGHFYYGLPLIQAWNLAWKKCSSDIF